MANYISINGKMMGKEAFFEMVWNCFNSMDDSKSEAEVYEIGHRLNVYRNLLRSMGWLHEYAEYVRMCYWAD